MASFLAIATLGAGCSPSRPQAQAAEPAQLPAIEFAGEWGVHGQEPGQLDHPVGPAVDAAGRVYLADRGTGFVQKFAADGTALLSFEDSAVREASAIAAGRPPGTRIPHSFRAGVNGLTYLAYGTRDAADILWYPRSNKVFFRGLGVIARLELLDYMDGEPG